MAKYLVEGFIKVKMEVEADSEDEAMETAEENFAFDQHVDEDTVPNFEVANLIEPDEDDEEDKPIRGRSTSRFDDEDED